MCDRWQYTVVFWNKRIGLSERTQIENFETTKEITNKFLAYNPLYPDAKKKHKNRAFISGSFTKWEMRKMLTMAEFCALLEENTEFFESSDQTKSI
jgi:hypothetical protein